MKRTSLLLRTLLLCMLLTVSSIPLVAQEIWDGTASAQWSGSGTEADPYLISNAKQLAGLAKRVNSGLTYHDMYFKLTNDILLNDTTNWQSWEIQAPVNSWTPIGDESTSESYFAGEFDGDGHIIAGMYIDNYSDKQPVGLFGNSSYNSFINLHVRASFIRCTNVSHIGLLVGVMGGLPSTIDNCSVEGKVIAIGRVRYMGGLAGTLEVCNNSTSLVDFKVQYIAGYDFNCGGISGLGHGQNCSSTGSIVIHRPDTLEEAHHLRVGGLFGIGGDIYNSNSSVNISIDVSKITEVSIGGLIGRRDNKMAAMIHTNCYASNNIAVKTGNGVLGVYVGGILGYGERDYIKNSYATSNLMVEANSTMQECNVYVGGLLGTGHVVDSYYTEGYINASTKLGTIHKGGLVGQITETNITNSYYNVETSGIADNDNLWAKTPQELKTKLTYNDWEFENVWGRSNAINNGYPYLRWTQQEQLDTFDPAITFKGAGTEKDPYKISTAEDWRGFVKSLNGNTFVHKYITLTNDIFLNDTTGWRDWEFNPPANNDAPAGTEKNAFRGHFDGAGHTIYGLYIQRKKATHAAGLFGIVRPGATFKQLRVAASHIEINAPDGISHIGGLVGGVSDTRSEYALSTDTVRVSECAVDAFIFGKSEIAYVGGLIGSVITPTHIQHCFSRGIITGWCTGWEATAGGLIGTIKQNSNIATTLSLFYCYTASLIDGSSRGGVLGRRDDGIYNIKNCYYDQDVSLLSGDNFGALSKPTADMKRAATYENWDFTNIWGRRDDTNDGYPYLRCFEGTTLLNDVEGIVLDQHELLLPLDTIDAKLAATILPANHEKVICTWSSDDNSIISIQDGLLTPHKTGSTMVRVKTDVGNFIDSCKVTIWVPVDSVVIDPQQLTMAVNDTFQLKAIIYPQNATNQNVKWKSSYSYYANVSETGLVTTGNNTSTVQIIVTTEENNFTDTCEITIVRPVTGVTLNKQALSLRKTGTEQLRVTITPSNATNKKVLWSNTNPAVASVSESGYVTALAGGSDTIIVTTEDGGFKDSCFLNVIVPITSVALDISSMTLKKGDSYQLKHTISPLDATNQQVTYSSSNTNVISVTNEGLVTALASGSATVTVKTADGNRTATCSITVPIDVTGITLDEKTLDMKVGDKKRLYTTISPWNATTKDVIWTNTNPTVTTVDQLGYVTALAAGTDTITVTTKDGGFTDYCVVTVTVPVTSVTLDVTTLSLRVGDTYQLQHTVLPANATNKKVTYELYIGGSAVSVTADGLITALRSGTATVRVKTEDGNKTATCKVTVTNPVTAITLNYQTARLEVEDELLLQATFTPSDADDQDDLVWTSTNPSVITLGYIYGIYDNYANVQALAEGTAKVIVTTADGLLADTCEITVNKKIISVTSVKIDNYAANATATLDLNATKQFTANIYPTNATNQNVTWSSSNSNVVSIDQNGLARAVGVGTAVVTVTTQDGNYSASITITVKKPIVSVTGVTLSDTKIALTTNKTNTHQLTATISPADADEQTVTWRSLNTSIATVSTTGLVTALKNGLTLIQVTTKDGNYTATCEVTVTTAVTSITLNKSELSLQVGQTERLVATVLPATASNKTVTWKTDNAQVATVTNGLITAVGNGTTTITATTADGNYIATCEVTVTTPVSEVLLDANALDMLLGETQQLTATIFPATASNQAIIWQSTNTAIASVENGLVTAIGEGTTTIIVSTIDGNHSDSCIVTVKLPFIAVTGITLDPTEMRLGVGKTKLLTATVLPENATNKDVTFVSTDESVAITADDWVIAVGEGEAKINAVTADGGFVATCKVIVEVAVTSITLSDTVVFMQPETTKKITATVLPENAANKNYTITSDNEDVVIVAANGWLIANQLGTATITATTEDGGFMATCKVTVQNELPTGIDNVEPENIPVRKVFENGTIYILKPNGDKYTIDGRKVN